MSVKQERFDDAEINEMAAKFKEVHKVKQASAANTSATNNRPQSMNNILGFLTKTNGKRKLDGSVVPPGESPEKSSVTDERSMKGQFGWTTLADVHIPYIFRGTDDKYSAVRIIEMKVLNKHLRFLHQDIYNCTCIRSYYITEAEARLLNEINFLHCDSQFGSSRFTGEDLIVRLSDAVEFYKFLDACSLKLLTGSSDPLDRCGFIRINQESVVPYTIYQGDKFVPLFYFEGETDNLKKRANKLEGWDLSYLKFCCKVQGIRNELFAHDSCSVISLNDIRNYFPPGTTFEDYWPRMDTQYLLSNKASNQTQVGQWTRQPVGPPIATASHSQHLKTAAPAQQPKPAPAVNQQIQHNVQNLYNNYPIGTQSYQATPRTLSSSSRATYAASSRQTRPYTYPPAPPPPLVRAGYPGYAKEDWPTASFPNSQSISNSNYLLLGDGYNRAQAPIHKYPPALIPVRQVNGGLRYENNLYQPDLGDLSASNHQIINQQPAHQQPPRSQTSTQDDRTNGRISNAQRKMIQIPDTPTSGSHIPYKMQKAIIEGKPVSTINMKPYIYTDLLVTIHDLVNNFFNNVPVHSCQQVMQVLGIELYKGNAAQMHVLVESGKCQSINDVCPLVQVRNVIDYMPQLKYMLGRVDLALKHS